MKLIGLAVATLAAVAVADKATFDANKAAERLAILAQKEKAWAVKEAQRLAKDEENMEARSNKDDAKANSWSQKEAVREAKDLANQSVRDEKDAAKANSWAIKEDIREMKDVANAIIQERKDAAKANSWEIRQVIRDRKDAAKAVVDFNRDSAKAAVAAVRAAFWEVRADQKVNFNVRVAGLRSEDMYCHNTDDVSSTWMAGDNGIAIDGFVSDNVHQGMVAIGRSTAQSGNWFISLVGGFGDKQVYAAEGEGSMTSKRSPYGKYDDIFWNIMSTDTLAPSNDVMNVQVAHAGRSAGSELTWMLCTDRMDDSNPCATEPCMNAGTCSVSEGNAMCDCMTEPVEFEGPTCETCTCANSGERDSCSAFLFLAPGHVGGCDELEHCDATDPCIKFASKCDAVQANCGSGVIQAVVPCVLLSAIGKTCVA